jgi:hypothetical protein
MPDIPPQMITCRHCGQVGTIVIDPSDEYGERQRRHGFYLQGKREGLAVVACCKCRQIQECDINT